MLKNWLRTRTSEQAVVSHCVLIVGDDADVLSLIGDTLQQKNYRVQSSNNVAETLRLLDLIEPVVLICDFTRPEVEGKQLLEAARVRLGKSGMPAVLFLRDSQEDEAFANAMGVEDLMLKPFDSATLFQHVDKLVLSRCHA